jgi:hypothetical protein
LERLVREAQALLFCSMSKPSRSLIVQRAFEAFALLIVGLGIIIVAIFLPLSQLFFSKGIPIWFWIMAPFIVIASQKIGFPKAQLWPVLAFVMLPMLTGLYFREGWITSLAFMYTGLELIKRSIPEMKHSIRFIKTGKVFEKTIQVPKNLPFDPVLPNYMPKTYKLNSYESYSFKGVELVSITYTQPNWDYFIWLKEARGPIPDLEPKKNAIVTQETINSINIRIARLKRKKKGDLPFTEVDWDMGGLYFNLRALGVRDELVLKIIESLIR